MITVGELIEHLKTLDATMPVTGFGGDEMTGFITKASVRVEQTDRHGLWYRDDKGNLATYEGPYLDIMAGE